jgi:hypothetical protein
MNHPRSICHFFALALSAAVLAIAATGCSFSAGSSDVTKLFKRAPKWAPTNFTGLEITTLAIVVDTALKPSEDFGVTAPIVSSADQEFTQACLNRGFQLVSRVRIQEWQKEIKLQNIGLTDPASVTRAGKMLNASHLLVITPNVSVQMQHGGNSQSYYSQQGRMDCQILETETARTVAACSDNDSNSFAQEIHDIVPLMARLARRIAGALPNRNALVDQGAPKTR